MPAPQVKALRPANRPFPQKSPGHLSVGWLCTGLWQAARCTFGAPLRTISQFALVLRVLWMQALWLSKIGVYRDCLGVAFKSGTKGLKPFAAWSCELLLLGCCSRDGAYGRLCLSLSYPLQYKFMLICPACRNGLGSFWVSFRRNCPICSYGVCLWEEMNSGSSYVAILSQNLVNLFLR